MTKRPTYMGWNEDYSEQELLRYISGDMPALAQEALKQRMESDAGLKAAVEGLQALKGPDEVATLSRQLKQQLKHQVEARRSRHHTFIRSRWWVWLAALILLLLVFIAFAYYQMLTP